MVVKGGMGHEHINTHILIHYKYESFYQVLKDAHKLHV